MLTAVPAGPASAGGCRERGGRAGRLTRSPGPRVTAVGGAVTTLRSENQKALFRTDARYLRDLNCLRLRGSAAVRGGCGVARRNRERGLDRAHDVGDLQEVNTAPIATTAYSAGWPAAAPNRGGPDVAASSARLHRCSTGNLWRLGRRNRRSAPRWVRSGTAYHRGSAGRSARTCLWGTNSSRNGRPCPEPGAADP